MTSAAAEQFREAFIWMYERIDEREFKPREARALHLINKLSFGRGFVDANIDRLDHFEAVGISRGNAWEIVDRLKRMGVIEEPVKGFFGFMFPVDNWTGVLLRRGDAGLLRQLELLERPASLPSAMREVFVESMPAVSAAGIHGKRKVPGPADSCHDAPSLGAVVGGRPARPVPNLGAIAPSPGAQHEHVSEHALKTAYSMSHEHAIEVPKVGVRLGSAFDSSAVLRREFNSVGLGKTGEEILEAVKEAAPSLKDKFVESWIRRIGENAELVFELAMEAKVRTGIGNTAAWMNRAYMREMRLGKWSVVSARTARP